MLVKVSEQATKNALVLVGFSLGCLGEGKISVKSKSRRSVRENAMVFSHMAILTNKAFTSDHLFHVSIFIVFLLRTDRILCVCVCVCSVLTLKVYKLTYHTSICRGGAWTFYLGGLTFIWGSVQFCSILFGGLAHCKVQSVSLCFARLNFIGGGGLQPPPALMTRRPWVYVFFTCTSS